MYILNKTQNDFELKIETIDDLWILSEFISPNDVIFSTTQRKVKIGNEKTKQISKIIFVELKVKKALFNLTRLKISGEILNETEFTSIGQSQTLNFSVNDKIKIRKDLILKYHLRLLNNSVNSKHNKSLLILLDRDELILAEFSNFNYSHCCYSLINL